MKKVKIIAGAAFLAAVALFTMAGNGNVQSDDISLANLAALQSSAGEAYCDQSDQTICVIRIEPGGIRGVSIGKVVGSTRLESN